MTGRVIPSHIRRLAGIWAHKARKGFGGDNIYQRPVGNLNAGAKKIDKTKVAAPKPKDIHTLMAD